MKAVVAIALIALGPLTCLEGEDEAERRQARRIWVDHCADCHGLTGRADGALARSLAPPPPDFHDPCRDIDPDRIERVIVRGGASFGGSEAMRAHHELRYQPEVLEELVTFVQMLRDERSCSPPRR